LLISQNAKESTWHQALDDADDDDADEPSGMALHLPRI
jgi:hypothetical protein